MKPLAIALALSTLCLTSCGDEHPGRIVPLTPDPVKLAACPATWPAPPTLKPLSPFKLADGREVVLLDTVIDRETTTAHYIIEGRGAWHECSSAVRYSEDWSASVKAGK
jgi:hypothetical protein